MFLRLVSNEWLALNAFNTVSKTAIQTTEERKGYLVGNKIEQKITKAATKSNHKNSKSTTTSKYN